MRGLNQSALVRNFMKMSTHVPLKKRLTMIMKRCVLVVQNAPISAQWMFKFMIRKLKGGV